MPKISAKSKLKKKKKNNNNKQNKKNIKKEVFEEKQIEIEQQCEIEEDLSYLLRPIQAHDLKNGMYCIDDKCGFPGIVRNLKQSKTGKHGHAKFTYKLIMQHNGKTSNPMHPGNDQLMKPTMNKDEFRFIKFVDDKQKIIQCIDNKTNKIYHIGISQQPKVYEKVIDLINKKKDKQILNMTVLSGPKLGSKNKIEIIRCVIGGKLIDH